MSKPLPPKPKLKPLIQGTVMAAALGVAGCSSSTRHPVRIGQPPPPPYEEMWLQLRGQAVDDAGEPLANTALRVTIDGDERIVTTDALGQFSLDGLPGGRHTLTISADGFAPTEIEAFVDGGSNVEVVLQRD